MEGCIPEDLLVKPVSYFKTGKFTEEHAKKLQEHYESRRKARIEDIKKRRSELLEKEKEKSSRATDDDEINQKMDVESL